jgi:hypothetical protein
MFPSKGRIYIQYKFVTKLINTAVRLGPGSEVESFFVISEVLMWLNCLFMFSSRVCKALFFRR